MLPRLRFKNNSAIDPSKSKMLLKQIHAFVLNLLRSGADKFGIIYFDDFLQRFVFQYVVGSKMLKVVFDEASLGVELYDYDSLETKLPHAFTKEDWETVFMILNSAYNYMLSRSVSSFDVTEFFK